MLTRNWYSAIAQMMTWTKGAEFTSYKGVKGVSELSSNYVMPSINGAYNGASVMKNLYTTIKSSNRGVVMGDGGTPPTVDDYTLAGTVFETFSYSSAASSEFDENGASYTVLFTITNTGESDFTVRELGLFAPASIGGAGTAVMYDRTVLESPITIPAGGVGQVTYTIRMNYPT